MPLRALLNNSIVHAFEYSQIDWLTLKSSPDKVFLKMPCCNLKAIPKNSKLGTQYFAHTKRGECSSGPESQQHLYLKSLVAMIAVRSGWIVTTEKLGKTPKGEGWIADVFCQKGTAKIAIEIQWSYQSHDEYKRRTKKYVDSGVRCLWLFKLNNSRAKGEFDEDIFQSKDLPYFGFANINGQYFIPRYIELLESFIDGIFTKKLIWVTDKKDKRDGWYYKGFWGFYQSLSYKKIAFEREHLLTFFCVLCESENYFTQDIPNYGNENIYKCCYCHTRIEVEG